MVGIVDRSIAFAFDLKCGEYLLEFEAEQENARFEAMAVSGLSKAFGVKQSGPPIGKVSGEITQANFRDQGF